MIEEKLSVLDLISEEAKASFALDKLKQVRAMTRSWPENHLHSEDGQPVPFHKPQNLAINSNMRVVAMYAGSQSGKTSFGPWWLEKEIRKRGGGDYIAATSTFDLFKLKMLPTMLQVFCDILGVGRFWTGDRIIELCEPDTGKFLATRSTDKMWGRIILRSADALSGLESATAKGAWLDECGQDRFTLQAYKAIKRRLTLYIGRILMTTTLYNVGWTNNLIITPANIGGEKEYIQVGKGEIEHTVNEEKSIDLIQFDSIINPMFPESEYEEAKELLSEEEFAMFFRGRKANLRYLIYNNFERVSHTIQPFRIPTDWKRFVGIDFGGVHTCAIFYAEEPATGLLYAYREYLQGDIPVKQHVENLRIGEPEALVAYGGSYSEGQWRMEFAQHGLQVKKPTIKDVDVGIARVYAQHQKDSIIYFNNLNGILDEKGRYRRKRDPQTGEILDEIEDKNSFHHLDAERYIICSIRAGVPIRPKILLLGE